MYSEKVVVAHISQCSLIGFAFGNNRKRIHTYIYKCMYN